jgi:hypothetical protein
MLTYTTGGGAHNMRVSAESSSNHSIKANLCTVWGIIEILQYIDCFLEFFLLYSTYIRTVQVPFELLDTARSPLLHEGRAVRWRGANSISKFDHTIICKWRGAAVDNVHDDVTGRRQCKLNLLMRYVYGMDVQT